MSRLTVICTFAAAVVLSYAVLEGAARDAVAAAESQGEVLLTELSNPIYPRVAMTAGVWGDVDVLLGIGQDGNVESAAVVSGSPLLTQAALNSAQQSQFRCVGCTEVVTSYHLVYAFRLGHATHCATTESPSTPGTDEPRSSVTQSLNHITVFETPIGTCDLPAVIGHKVRSAKCLYLWRCALRNS